MLKHLYIALERFAMPQKKTVTSFACGRHACAQTCPGMECNKLLLIIMMSYKFIQPAVNITISTADLIANNYICSIGKF